VLDPGPGQHLGAQLGGGAVQNLSYDAWGKRRNPNCTDDPAGSITSQATRGFTGEEELSVAGLIHPVQTGNLELR
jgi:hypothetical protein